MSSFLDNSGDIVLDAVLTKLGRKKLSEGSFRIAKFAFGDDEIDYADYDINNPSGSAYYDLEILQTPIFQGNTANSADLRFKLTTNANNNLLYMPQLKQNIKITTESVYLYNGQLYVAVNGETKTKLDNQIGTSYSLESGASTGLGYLFEAGLDTTSLVATAANRQLITAQNMMDSSFDIQVDTRFIAGVMGPRGGTFTNTYNSVTTTFAALRPATTAASAAGLANYTTFPIGTIPNTIYYYGTSTTPDTSYSAIAGPRAVVSKLNFSVVPGLNTRSSSGTRSPLWAKHGAINQTLGSLTIDRLDTTVYIIGNRSGASIQLPVRLVRYVSG